MSLHSRPALQAVSSDIAGFLFHPNVNRDSNPGCRRSFFDQPSLQLSPATQFNPKVPNALRNPVPLTFPQEPSLARSVAERFDGVSVEGIGVSTAGAAVDDGFAGCAQGAGPLVNMSDFLLKPPTSGEQGASR